jgi:hypothetical protein
VHYRQDPHGRAFWPVPGPIAGAIILIASVIFLIAGAISLG